MCPEIVDYVGDQRILELHKIGFLCSRDVEAGRILKCYDWAVEQREAGRCVVSGFHSTIEKDVLHYLLQGNQPIVLALHRGIGSSIRKLFLKEVEAGRLLIVSPFPARVSRGSARTAELRNLLIGELCDEITIGYASPGGNLSKLAARIDKPVVFL